MSARTKHAGLTGYRLHLRRFAYTGKQGMRSVKLPISYGDGHSAVEKDEKLCASIAHDQLYQVGPLTVSAWLAERASGEPVYALTDLWLDALRAGFIFAPSTAILLDTLATLGVRTSPDRRAEEALAACMPDLADVFDIQKLKDAFLLRGEVRSTATKESVARKFVACAREDISEAQRVRVVHEGQVLARALFGASREVQDTYWREHFGIDKAWWRADVAYAGATMVPLPDLPFAPEADAGTCLAAYRAWGTSHPGVTTTADELKRLLGLTDNYNALANFLNSVVPALQHGADGVQELVRMFRTLVPTWDDASLRVRVEWLSKRVAHLPSCPHLARSWADYRSTFGGKLSSWYSNRVNQEEHVSVVLALQEKDLALAETYLATLVEDEVLKRAQSAVARAREARGELVGRVLTEQKLMAYRDMIADVRRTLLPLIQREYEDVEDIGIVLTKRYPGLFGERVRFLPGFVGDQKRAFFTRYVTARERVLRGVAFLSDVERALDGNPANTIKRDEVLRALDTLLRLYRRGVTTRFAQVLEALFSDFGLDVRACATDSALRIWVSRYARVRVRVVEVREGDPVADARTIVACTAPRWKELATVEDMLVAVEIEKVRFSLMVRLVPDMSVTIHNAQIEGFDAAQGYVSLMSGERFAGDDLGRLLQQYVLAEMRGALALMSRGEYVVRAVAQPMGSDAEWPLVYVPREVTHGVTRANRRSWGFVRKEHLHKQGDDGMITVFVKEGKDALRGWKRRFVRADNLALVRSGVAQLQFFDNTLPEGDCAAWTRFVPELNSWSLIGEETYRVSWDTGVPMLTRGGVHLFVSVPMTLGVARIGATKRLKERTRLLGADVGEYGIAWTLIDTATGVAGPSGFASVPSLRMIRAGVRAVKEKQAGGTFTVPSTYVDRLRDDAVTALRNRLHDVVVRYDARVVYEDSISNFETGSGRVTKVYNSVKRADVYAGNDAGKMAQALVWGKTTGLVGATIGSRGTSRVCSACFECAYNYLHERDTETRCTVLSIDGEDAGGVYVKLALPEDVRATGFIKGGVSMGDTLSAKEAIGALYAASRPPFESSRARKALARACPDFGLKHLERFVEKRGNSALFVCPFCEHVSDADVQASLTVALKRYWKDKCVREADVLPDTASPRDRARQFASFTSFARAWYRDQCGNGAVPFFLE